MYRHKYSKYFISGFTLIELLVVISIIGLLSSIVLANLNVARLKARDARRLSDIHQIQNALEMYRSANNSYPISGNTRENSCFTANPSTDTSVPGGAWDSTLSVLVPNYLPNLIRDPLNNGVINGRRNYCYSYVSSKVTTYGSCLDIKTGLFESLSNYEYVIYLSLENTPTSGKVINWKADSNPVVPAPIPADTINNKPYNYCIFGPHK